MDETATDEMWHFTKEGSKIMIRTTFFRASLILVAMMAAALVAMLAVQKPAAGGIVIDDGLCLPPDCPPETTITSAPLEVETSTTASFSFSGHTYGIGLSFECKLDGGSWSACASPKEYTNLSDGPHTFQVKAISSRNGFRTEDYTPASHTWTVYATQPPPPDTTPPRTTITNYPSGSISSNTARFVFTGSDDRTRLEDLEFQCRFDGTSDSDWSTCSSPKEYTGLSDGPHTFQVRAKDPAGNVDLTPESRQFSVDTADTTPPQTKITSSHWLHITDQTDRFHFEGLDDRTAVADLKFECRMEGVPDRDWTPCTSPKVYTGVSDGYHTFQVRARDSSNNVDATPDSRQVLFDASPPDTVITSNPTDPSDDSTPTFEFSMIDNAPQYAQTASFLMCRHSLSGSEGAWFRCSSPYTLPPLSTSGTYTFEVRAYDGWHRPDPTPASYTWRVTIDTTPPPAPVITSPANDSIDADGNITFSGTAEANSTVELFEGADSRGTATVNASGEWSKSLTGVADGSHTYTARASDAAGNVSAESEARTVVVDFTKPTVASVAPAQNATGVAPGANISAAFSEAMATDSINRRNFTLYEKGSTTAIRATVTYDAVTNRAVLNPGDNLRRGATYKAVVTAGARDLAGNPLDQSPSAAGNQNKVWFFTIRR